MKTVIPKSETEEFGVSIHVTFQFMLLCTEHRPGLKLEGSEMALIGFVEAVRESLATLTVQTLLKHANSCVEVKVLLEYLFNLADASP